MDPERKSQEPKVADYERIISQVKGVISARLATNSEGVIEEIHVLALPERNPKQIVRDIETAVMVQLGMAIDHKKISVAQIALEEKIQESRSFYFTGLHDFKLLSLSFVASGLDVEIKVEISIKGHTFFGQSSGPNAPSLFPRLAASAVLSAIEKYFEGSCRLALQEIKKVWLNEQEALLVSALHLSPQGEEYLLGTAFVGKDELGATARAILQALGHLFWEHSQYRERTD